MRRSVVLCSGEILAALDVMPANAIVTMSTGDPKMDCSFRKVADDLYQGVYGRHTVDTAAMADMIESVCRFGYSVRYGN